ncbi:MAG: DUF2232 domain-containing protein [Gemmatimonadetes bacterium]|nr:DUF2232 domain-containing protein [Gemmatimonadota bacterium]
MGDDTSRGWRRALGLFAVAMATSVVQPSVLVAVPLLVLLGLRGGRGAPVFFVTGMAVLVTVVGTQDAFWFTERAWALMLGGVFVALTMAVPRWGLASRALASVIGTAAVWGGILTLRTGAWAAIDWSVTDRLRTGFSTWMDAMVVLRQGEAVPPAMVSAIYQTVEAQAAVFPAMVALESVAALGVAWWLYVRLVQGSDRGLGPLSGFRFNDHLVWLMIVGLFLMAVRSGEALTRVGANVSVFMGALYAVRGAGVFLFLTGGLSLLTYVMFALGFVFAAPVVIGFAVFIGIADTWLDLRARAALTA